MKEHPGHFWVCFWIFISFFFLSGDIAKITKAIEANTAAIQAKAASK